MKSGNVADADDYGGPGIEGMGLKSEREMPRPKRSKNQGRCCKCCWSKKEEGKNLFLEGLMNTPYAQGLVFGLITGLLLALNLVALYDLNLLSQVYFVVLEVPLFAPFISIFVYIVVVAIYLIKWRDIKRHRKIRFIAIMIYLVVALVNFVVLFYSLARLFQFHKTVREVGIEDTRDAETEMEMLMNDYSLAFFQGCCYLRGWAKYPMGSCYDSNFSVACPYAPLEDGACSCILDEQFYNEVVTSIDSLYCFYFAQGANDDSSIGYNILAPPQYSGCGAYGNTSVLDTGLPSYFQAQFARYVRTRTSVLWITLTTFVAFWILEQIIVFILIVTRFLRNRIKSKRKLKRRKEILKQRVDLLARTANETQRTGVSSPETRMDPIAANSEATRLLTELSRVEQHNPKADQDVQETSFAII